MQHSITHAPLVAKVTFVRHMVMDWESPNVSSTEKYFARLLVDSMDYLSVRLATSLKVKGSVSEPS